MRAPRAAIATVAATATAAVVACAGPAGSTGSARPTVPATTGSPASQISVASASLPRDLVGVHRARQVISVIATGYATSYATVRGFRKTSDGWRRTFGPWPARIGRNGFAPRGDKREGDGRTPTGSYHFTFAFGVDPDPGTRLRYRRALSTSRWDDDPQSANYNRWVDTRYGDPGRDPEHMRVLPQYRHGLVIGYNTDRTPSLGSAIFFHVTGHSATAGCVAVSRHRVVRVLRWLRPHLRPRIIMGTRAAVTR